MATEIFYESLSETETAVLDTLRRFSLEVLRPVGAELDRLPAEAVIARDSILWDTHEKYRALGMDAIAADGSLSPAEQARLTALSSEMMGWGDAGLAISLGVSNMPATMANGTGNPELIDTFANRLGCWAVTEPNHGSDVVDFGQVNAEGAEPLRGDCVARRDGDNIVINGQKSSWVSNGSIAEAASLFCSYEDENGVLGGGVFLVPLDIDGVSRGKPTDKVGQRPLNQGEIFFDNVVIPVDHMIAGTELYSPVLEATLTGANGGMGSLFAGLARAAFEHAVNYAKERVQGGKPIFEHQAVRTRLFEMFRKVEAARALNLKVVTYNATNPPRLELAITSKVTSTRAAMEVATEAMYIYGGAGMTRDNPIEKLMRDASVSVIEDGENTLLGLIAAARL
jgi:alkylation response protein AidB-like acyl-CoA dehydrogenase